jgi:hypothetical protein
MNKNTSQNMIVNVNQDIITLQMMIIIKNVIHHVKNTKNVVQQNFVSVHVLITSLTPIRQFAIPLIVIVIIVMKGVVVHVITPNAMIA